MTDATGEIELCDLEVELADQSERSLEIVRALLERLGAPKGSSLIVDDGQREIPFGTSEGLALYLNGTELPDEVYRDCDVNHVYDELNRFARRRGDDPQLLGGLDLDRALPVRRLVRIDERRYRGLRELVSTL